MMKSYGLLGLLGFIVMPVVFALPAHAQNTPRVVISEINWAGSEISTADEWIELVNVWSEPVDVSNYVLTGVATGGGAIEIAEGTVIQPHQTLLIANYNLGDPKTTLTMAPNLVTTAISLPNSALDILLADPDGLVVDSYLDTGVPDFGTTKPSVSIERDLANMTWRSSTTQTNLSFATQLGTPGVANVPIAAEALQTTETSTLAPTDTTTVISEIITETTSTTTNDPLSTSPVSPEPTVLNPQTTDATPEPIAIEPTPVIETPDSLPVTHVDIVVQPQSIPASTDTPLEITDNPIVTVDPVTPNSSVIDIPTTPSIKQGQLIFNEVVSDPIDNVEWIELFNASSETLDLAGSKLVDAGEHTTLLPAQSLAAQNFLIIENPSGNLNNTGDSLTLFNAHGVLLDTLTYGTADIPAPEDGESLALDSDGSWRIAIATRDRANVFPTPITVIEQTSTSDFENVVTLPDTNFIDTDTSPLNNYETYTNAPDSSVSNSGTTQGTVAPPNNTQSASTQPVHRIVAVAKSVDTKTTENKQLKSKKSNQQTTITGTVVALPDVFGKQTMFLDGYELYFNAAEWPALALGDVVRVIGTQSTNNGAPRLKISNADNIAVINHIEVTPAPIAGADLATTRHGALVTITGKVVNKDGGKLAIKTDDGTVITALANKRTNVSWSQMQSGTVTLTGIVKHSESGKVIAVRSMDDVRFVAEAVMTTTKTPKAKNKTSPLVGGGLLTGTLGALSTWYIRSRTGL